MFKNQLGWIISSILKYIRLKSLHNRYLVARKDGVTVKQSRKGNAVQAYWGVEMVEGMPNLIRLRSCHDKFLTATDESFLLGWTGNKVLQTSWIESDPAVHWEPVRDHSNYIRLRSPLYNKYLRANNGTPPWRKSVTVDVPELSVTQDWTLWCFGAMDAQGLGVDKCLWPKSINTDEAYSPWQDDVLDSPSSCSSPMAAYPPLACKSVRLNLQDAKTVRLLSNHDKYLTANKDCESVIQDRRGSSKRAYWTVEYIKPVKGGSLIRLKSCFGKYLTATDDDYLLGVTGKKVKQTIPERLDYSIEWEMIREGMLVKLKTWDGNYLRANGGLPPWRNSVTHDVPSISTAKDWVLWEIEVFEVYENNVFEVYENVSARP